MKPEYKELKKDFYRQIIDDFISKYDYKEKLSLQKIEQTGLCFRTIRKSITIDEIKELNKENFYSKK